MLQVSDSLFPFIHPAVYFYDVGTSYSSSVLPLGEDLRDTLMLQKKKGNKKATLVVMLIRKQLSLKLKPKTVKASI